MALIAGEASAAGSQLLPAASSGVRSCWQQQQFSELGMVDHADDNTCLVGAQAC